MNAVALRFLNFLTDNTIKVKVENFFVAVTHPANFALHKLIIFQRRRNEDKAVKDRNSAVEILKALIGKGEAQTVVKIFTSVPTKWQSKIIKGLETAGEKEILKILKIRGN